MFVGRLTLSIALLVAALLGATPLRICAHADGGHARVWIPTEGCHEHVSPRTQGSPRASAPARCGPGCRDAHRGVSRHVLKHGHAHRHAHAAARAAVHEAGAPIAPPHQGEDHCHCGDQPLVTGQPIAPIVLESPAQAFDACGAPWMRRHDRAPSAQPEAPGGVPQLQYSLETAVLLR